MRAAILVILALLTLPAAAPAAGINLYWSDCGTAGTSHRNFACDTDAGVHLLYASFDPPHGLTAVNGSNLVLEVYTGPTAIPPWWQFRNAGTCRQMSLRGSGDFSAGPYTCLDPWNGAGVAGISAYLPGASPSRVRIGGTVSVGGAGGPVAAGTEYYALVFAIDNRGTVGPDGCAGCSTPLCIVLNEVKLTQPAGTPGGSPILTGPLTSNYVTWQRYPDFCFVPAIRSTWGRVKDLYR